VLLLLSSIICVFVFVAPPPPAVTDGRAAREACPGERDMTGSESTVTLTGTDGATEEIELSFAPTVAAAAAAATASFACRTCLEEEEEEDFVGK